MAPYHFLTCHWWLWHKIWSKRTRQPPPVYASHPIQNRHWLDQYQVLWSQYVMVSLERHRQYFLARIHLTCTPQVSAPHLSHKTTFTPCLLYPKIRYQAPDNYPCWYIRPSWFHRHHAPPINIDSPPALWYIRQQHHYHCPRPSCICRQHPIPIISYHPASKLLCHTHICHHTFLPQRHVPQDSQWHFLPIPTQITQPHRRILLPQFSSLRYH